MTRATVAIVARPNVGKSTLFNRLVGGRQAIVHDRPGVTRDRNFSQATWAGYDFWLVDTGGWISGEDDALASAIRDQVEAAIQTADAVVFVVDTREGVHPADLEVAQILRRHSERVLVAANKADELATDVSFHQFHELGLGEPCPVSAGTGKGSGDLLDRLVELLPREEAGEADPDQIGVAVVGRPNVGKSSVVNRLLGEERSVVSADAGTTRDAIDSPLRYHGMTLNFIDTAGLRKRTKVEDEVEFYSTLRTEQAIDRADVCILVVDAALGVHAQDLKIAAAIWDSGAGLIVAVNKWDLVEAKEESTARRGQQEVLERAPFLRYVPFVYISALTGQRVRKVLDLILEVAERRRQRIATGDVNRILEGLLDRLQPPQQAGQEVKLLYASQVGTAPPVFAIVSNRPDAVPESYQRFLVNGFRSAWGFDGVPIRLKLRKKRGPALTTAAVFLGAYLMGAIPTSWLAARLVAGIDLREHGSKNLGATNLYRVLGWRYAIPVGVFDIAKGAVPVVLLAPLAGAQPWMPIAVGLVAILGHVYSVFVGFRGGKGVATAAGVVAALAPLPLGVSAAIWVVVLKLTGYVSLASIAGAVAFPIGTLILRPDPYVLSAGAALAIFIMYTHRANIRRLAAGTENRFGRRREA